MKDQNSSIDINKSEVKNKIINLFQEEDYKTEPINYEHFYAVKGTLYKPVIKNWDEAENKNIISNLNDKIEEAIFWFNDGIKIRDRKLELVDLNRNSISLIVLISCVEKQEILNVTNKFGAFAKYLYNKMEFSKLVKKESKQRRLFTTQIKEVDKNLNIIPLNLTR